MDRVPAVSGTTSLIDILDRILDKGLVIAGDVSISLANVELLTIRIRLLVCSVDKAQEIGMDWWKFDPNLTSAAARRTLGLPPGVEPRAAVRASDAREKRRAAAQRGRKRK